MAEFESCLCPRKNFAQIFITLASFQWSWHPQYSVDSLQTLRNHYLLSSTCHVHYFSGFRWKFKIRDGGVRSSLDILCICIYIQNTHQPSHVSNMVGFVTIICRVFLIGVPFMRISAITNVTTSSSKISSCILSSLKRMRFKTYPSFGSACRSAMASLAQNSFDVFFWFT